MNHSVAQIVRQLLIDLDLGTDGGAWPVYHSHMPDTPDDCICVTDTEAFGFGRSQPTGETFLIHGVQVLVRAASVVDAYRKTKDINVAFDDEVLREEVVIDDDWYLVHAVSRLSAEIPVGVEPTSRRRLYSTNARVSVTYEGETGTAT